ncbi:hypothetical protein PHMEG_00038597 [Phytophthora megakarya]|uniref:Uncharacterized protein n=1 Tax=Phytophthora megakarya TaxID=4795 RepID=A0A225UIK2_9STRA|nr:hypothetical protein PHMEG_00038597 [Phytophthora megakarya]
MVLHLQPNNKVAIESQRNHRFLKVRPNGDCVFESREITERSLFVLKTNSTCSIFFASSYYMGNVLHCNDQHVARCANNNRELWEEWRIVEPRNQ